MIKNIKKGAINIDKKYCIYMHRNKRNGKIYIGQTSQKLNQRFRNGKGYINCSYFYKAIQKYGWENFEHLVLEDNLTSEQANIREQYYIKLYDATNKTKGYNTNSGGKNFIMSDEQRKKLSIIKTGKPGTKHTQTYKQQMSILMKKRWQNKQERAELCKNMKKNHADFKGGNHPEAKKVMRMDTKEIFSCCGEAAISINKDWVQGGKTIARAARGERKTAYGLEWRYIK